MSTEFDVNVNTTVLKGIEGIVNDAFERMQTSAKTVGAQSDAIAIGYQGTGTTTAMESYTNLSAAARALGEALTGLREDLNLTGGHAQETDAQAQQAAARGAQGAGIQIAGGM